MRYLFGVVVPLLLQILLVLLLIVTNSGNGSWVGLGALLIGMFAVPATAVINILVVRSTLTQSAAKTTAKCIGIAMVLPFVVILLLIAG